MPFMQTELEARMQSYFASLIMATMPVEKLNPETIRTIFRDVDKFIQGKVWLRYHNGQFILQEIQEGEI